MYQINYSTLHINLKKEGCIVVITGTTDNPKTPKRSGRLRQSSQAHPCLATKSAFSTRSCSTMIATSPPSTALTHPSSRWGLAAKFEGSPLRLHRRQEQLHAASSNCHYCSSPQWHCCNCGDFGLTVNCGALWREDVVQQRHDKGCWRGKGRCCRCGRFDGGVGVGIEDAKHELRVTMREHGGRGKTVHWF